jgi:hypothetical protein
MHRPIPRRRSGRQRHRFRPDPRLQAVCYRLFAPCMGEPLNDSIMDAAMNSISELSAGRETCSVLVWLDPENPRTSDDVVQRTLCKHAQEGIGKIILTINDQTVRHWVAISLDVECQSVPISATATICNSFGASHPSSGFAADAIRSALSTTS